MYYYWSLFVPSLLTPPSGWPTRSLSTTCSSLPYFVTSNKWNAKSVFWRRNSRTIGANGTLKFELTHSRPSHPLPTLTTTWRCFRWSRCWRPFCPSASELWDPPAPHPLSHSFSLAPVKSPFVSWYSKPFVRFLQKKAMDQTIARHDYRSWLLSRNKRKAWPTRATPAGEVARIQPLNEERISEKFRNCFWYANLH